MAISTTPKKIKVSMIYRRKPAEIFHFGEEVPVLLLIEFVLRNFPDLRTCHLMCQDIIRQRNAGNVVVIFYPDRPVNTQI